MLGQLDAAAIDSFVAAAGPGSESPLISAEIRHVGGGAMSRPQPHHGALRPTDPARFYTPYAYRRLRQVKAAYDPTNVIRANHPILPT